MEFGNKSYRIKTKTGTGLVTRLKILKKVYTMTKVYTSTSLMGLNFRCSNTTDGVTIKITICCLEEYQ